MSTNEDPARVGITFGALAEPLAKQIAAAGRLVDGERAKRWQKAADEITDLLIRGYLSDSEAHRARKRLVKEIAR